MNRPLDAPPGAVDRVDAKRARRGARIPAKAADDAPELDVLAVPLMGINLIEASAGTGKTWNICILYLRLLLERNLAVQDILVVTFTNAAAAELRERIRARIADTLAALRDPAASPAGDEVVARLLSGVANGTAMERAAMAQRLDVALHYFDEAAIFTIHGFCQRALADAAFSAGLPFTLDTLSDAREMTLEVVQDFWRRRIADPSCPAELAAYLCLKKDTPERYAALVARSLAKPLARHVWPADIDAPAAADIAVLVEAYEAARALWHAERAAIVACVRSSLPVLKRNLYKEESILQAAGEWDGYFRATAALAPLPAKNKLDLFTLARLRHGTRQDRVCATHPFFERAQVLLGARDAAVRQLEIARLALLRELIATAGPALREKKRAQRVIAFDDMLANLHAALAEEERPGLAASLRERFKAALIDEFQDTDPLQFAIFERLYGEGDGPVFLVGDPKQAIYSFRNADLHAYLAARRLAQGEYTLRANQRSAEGLIGALNALFSATREAFMLPGLAYRKVAMGTSERPGFDDRSQPRADLQVWMLPTADDGKPVSKQDARDHVRRATAAEIARLVNAAHAGRIAYDGRRLAAGDIAVLVRTHREGSELTRALADLGIGSVELSQASVFQSVDAEEVERVLLAINQPSRDGLLRAALATEMLGCDAATIAAISADEARLRSYLERFATYREIWLRQGVGVMYRRLLSDEHVSARMLRRRDGERRLTNLLHLGEQIHQAAALHPSPDALLRWLQEARRATGVDEVAQLRLESDRNLVQIVTIHKAKGLQFPIVFCPFLWNGATRSGGPKPEGCEYHDADGRAVIDFRPREEVDADPAGIRHAIKLEAAAEELRLIYVALTRAIRRCYLVAGCYTERNSTVQGAKSLLNWLAAGAGEMPAHWFDAPKAPADIAAAWQALAESNAGGMGLAPLPLDAGAPVASEEPAAASLAALAPPAAIAPAWRISSFSGLMSDAVVEAAANDHDARVTDAAAGLGAAPATLAPDDILRFPRGAAAGDCLHAVFERIDFTQPGEWPDACAQGLRQHPLLLPRDRTADRTALLARMVHTMLRDVLDTPLPGGIVLATLARERRLTELEFSLPVPRVSARALNASLAALHYDVPRLGFRDLEGYLKGFIDLVFEHEGRWYVLDWKSNHLGYAAADYAPAALAAAMTEHGYHLQYLLYALALHRYLRRCVPGYAHATHFGGVYYLFVRGVRPGWRNADGSPAGVFHHRPSAATLARLDALFAVDAGRATR